MTASAPSKSIKVLAPASIGNFVVGFDVLGANLHTEERVLGDELTLSQDSPAGYSAVGEFAYRLPQDKDNLVIKTALFFNEKLTSFTNKKPEKINFILSKNLPIGSGLGSSSSSIVAALYGLNEWYEQPFSNTQLVDWAAEIEGGNSGGVHYDNVAPSLLGGLQLINSDTEQPCQTIPFFDNLFFAICFPDIEITTKSARKILPETIPLKAGVKMQSRLGGFIAACFNQNQSNAIKLMKDDVVTPYRKQLIPHYDTASELAIESGALLFSISGSGPTCFALCTSEKQAKDISELMLKTLKQGEHSFACVATLDKLGARRVENKS